MNDKGNPLDCTIELVLAFSVMQKNMVEEDGATIACIVLTKNCKKLCPLNVPTDKRIHEDRIFLPRRVVTWPLG